MKNTVKEHTIKHNLCINCGLCKVSCPFDAITMVRNSYGELNPNIDKSKCKNCGLCVKYCPNTIKKIKEEAKKISSIKEPHTFGLENASYYTAWDNDEEQRLKCCSGGAVTKLASYLLENKIIDGMIHVERLWGQRGDFHYGARLSTTPEEIREHVSSAYQPIDFSDVLSYLEKGKTYFVTGTPCVIRGLKSLYINNHDFDKVKIMTCVLVCSHNTNTQFIDFLTEINELCNNQKWKVNIRHKDKTIPDANNFKNYIYTDKGVLLDKNRHDSGWTRIWRSYYFAMNCCLYCSDFWGYEADISVKDAWGKWSKEDSRGTSIVIIRNKELEKHFKASGLEFEEIDFETMRNHQKNTPIFKQTQAFNKNFKSIFSKSNRKNGLFRLKLISHSTKCLYKIFGYKFTAIMMKLIEFIAKKGEKL